MNKLIRLSFILFILLQPVISNGQFYLGKLKQEKPELDGLLKKPENKNPYPGRRQIRDVTKSQAISHKAGIQQNEHKLPLGWVYEIWNTATSRYEEQSRMDLKYPAPNQMRSYYIAGKDTSIYTETEFLPGFKNNEILNYILPEGLFNTYLIRPYYGQFRGSFNSNKVYEKVNNKWKLTQSIADKITVPYGFEYANTYSYSPGFEITGSGNYANDIWTSNLLINSEEQKEIRKKDTRGNLIEYNTYYQKVNGVYTAASLTAKQYDSKNRVIERISEGGGSGEKEKMVLSYPHKEEYKGSVSIWNGTDWVLSFKTLNANTYTNNDGLICNDYTSQRFTNNQWVNAIRYVYGYDQKDSLRLSFAYTWDNAGQLWKEDYLAKFKVDENGQRTEFEWYSTYGGGDKTEYLTDPKTGVRSNLFSVCSTLDDFSKGIYSPSVIYESHEATTVDTLDYYIEKRYENNKWVQVDSMANVYDKNGHILMMADDHKTSGVSSRYRFLYDKTEDAVKPEISTEISIYPNPVKKLLKISGPNDKYTVQIYTIGGKKVMYQENVTEVDISGLNAGTYLVSINSGKRQVVKKVIKI